MRGITQSAQQKLELLKKDWRGKKKPLSPVKKLQKN